jgi:ketosteroid isomerase-like protein
MKRALFAAISVIAISVGCERASANDNSTADEVIGAERAALDRWGKGDPQGYLEIMAPEVTYFDPSREKRVDGLQAMKDFIVPYTGKIKIDRYDMINPKVQVHGDVALLTFNLVSYSKQPDGTERMLARWNSTETYARIDGKWQIIHSHWSFVKPELKVPLPAV